MTYDAKVRAFVPLVTLREAYGALRRRFKRHWFYARFARMLALPAAPPPPKPRPKVLVAIVHVTSREEHANRETAAVKIERLVTTLDGLLCSFAHCELKLLVVTMQERHIVEFLPERLKRVVELALVDGGDPMFIGYPAQDMLIARRAEHDWFMFIEDDIEIRDSSFLDKTARFCALPAMERCVLMPNRFEYVDNVKRYIDLTHMVDFIRWNGMTELHHDGNRFAECSNHHAGMFLLSRAQVDLLVASGRDWRGQDIHGGSRESAATFSLMEAFTLYKPHPDNLYYLEVRHVDSRYSLMHPGVTAYCYTAVGTLAP